MRLFVDNLTNVDFSYLCPARGLLGETWLAHIELTGTLDEQGMVCDFGIVKKHLRDWLDTELDHRLLIPSHFSGYSTLTGTSEANIAFTLNNGDSVQMHSPAQAVTLIEAQTINPDTVARWCEGQLIHAFGKTVANIKLSFTPEQINTPSYHYSHGLKKHLGNCQRIAHGHRSQLLIWKDGELSPQLMQRWANTFKDIYIGTQEDICGETQHNWIFEYQAQQGRFTLSLPKKQCYMMQTDTTVELIAEHIAQVLKQEMPNQCFTVKAFEGIGKGAIIEL
ncbi:6-pyruvoyl trahydropterin synthase family protein [Marinagarivorans algicola]|uniref:6-pyruvoyl trahydropterin synthase family protein n=1 Tax=Marinagarivorans algicola TaxID=1513270 RepID=UPI0006B45133|nr:6-carboxytetrahydropterin synthase [Marinagarivorans algicola]